MLASVSNKHGKKPEIESPHSSVSTAEKVCRAVTTQHSTTSPQEAEYQQGQTVTVKCDLGHVVNLVSTQCRCALFT